MSSNNGQVIKRPAGIGNLNGPWQLLFKVGLVMLPLTITFVVAFAVHVNAQSVELREFKATTEASRWTATDQSRYSSATAVLLNGKVDKHDFGDFVHRVEEKLDGHSDRLARIEALLERAVNGKGS